MRIAVQKFGGTSVASEEGRLAAVQHVERALDDNLRVVVVVSAMGRLGDPYSTDSLLGTIDDKHCASAHDLDLLMACGETISAVTFATLLRNRGHEVTVLNGQQAGIVTNDYHGDAAIVDVKPQRIIESLSAGHIAVVTGFQGATANGDVTTLGRGGSDTTACALGSALAAEYVDIFSDVDGVMTADPRVASDARVVHRASYAVICELARRGAKVIHPYAIDSATSQNVPIRVRNTRKSKVGTWITSHDHHGKLHSEKELEVIGVAGRRKAWHIQFPTIAVATVGFDLLHSHFSDAEIEQISDTCGVVSPISDNAHNVSDVMSKLYALRANIEFCAQVTVVHSSLRVDSPDAAEMQRLGDDALAKLGAHVILRGSARHSIWWLVAPHYNDGAIRCLHDAFELGSVETEEIAVGQ